MQAGSQAGSQAGRPAWGSGQKTQIADTSGDGLRAGGNIEKRAPQIAETRGQRAPDRLQKSNKQHIVCITFSERHTKASRPHCGRRARSSNANTRNNQNMHVKICAEHEYLQCKLTCLERSFCPVPHAQASCTFSGRCTLLASLFSFAGESFFAHVVGDERGLRPLRRRKRVFLH